jgi:hypothetical protein
MNMPNSSVQLTTNYLFPYTATIPQSHQPHITIKGLALSFHIQEASDSILDLQPCYSDWSFSWLLSALQENTGTVVVSLKFSRLNQEKISISI